MDNLIVRERFPGNTIRFSTAVFAETHSRMDNIIFIFNVRSVLIQKKEMSHFNCLRDVLFIFSLVLNQLIGYGLGHLFIS